MIGTGGAQGQERPVRGCQVSDFEPEEQGRGFGGQVSDMTGLDKGKEKDLT